jgi:hypothetical protein
MPDEKDEYICTYRVYCLEDYHWHHHQTQLMTYEEAVAFKKFYADNTYWDDIRIYKLSEVKYVL